MASCGCGATSPPAPEFSLGAAQQAVTSGAQLEGASWLWLLLVIGAGVYELHRRGYL